jgi:hypothetical protein
MQRRIIRGGKNMYVVIGDGNPVFSTDVDDLAWEVL